METTWITSRFLVAIKRKCDCTVTWLPEAIKELYKLPNCLHIQKVYFAIKVHKTVSAPCLNAYCKSIYQDKFHVSFSDCGGIISGNFIGSKLQLNQQPTIHKSKNLKSYRVPEAMTAKTLAFDLLVLKVCTS